MDGQTKSDMTRNVSKWPTEGGVAWPNSAESEGHTPPESESSQLQLQTDAQYLLVWGPPLQNHRVRGSGVVVPGCRRGHVLLWSELRYTIISRYIASRRTGDQPSNPCKYLSIARNVDVLFISNHKQKCLIKIAFSYWRIIYHFIEGAWGEIMHGKTFRKEFVSLTLVDPSHGLCCSVLPTK